MILLANAEIEVHAEPESQRVEIRLSAFHGRSAFAPKETDFKRIGLARITEEIPCRLRCAFVSAVAKVRTGNNFQILFGKNVYCRAQNIVLTARHDERRPLGEFNCKMLQRSWNQQITRLNADRLSVGVHLVKKQLDRLFETVGGERGRRSSHQILVTGMEQRTAVLLNRILQKSAEKQLPIATGTFMNAPRSSLMIILRVRQNFLP